MLRRRSALLLLLLLLTACGRESAGGPAERTVSDIIAQAQGTDIQVSLEKKLSIPQDDRYESLHLQGGGTDGRYGYYLMLETLDSGDGRTKLVKVDLESWEIVAEVHDLELGHANDLTYDPRQNRLIVTPCGPKLYVLDADSLAVTEALTLDTQQYSLEYHPGKDRYVAGISNSYDGAVLDGSFQLLQTHTGVFNRGVRQGMTCDDNYIYYLRYGTSNNYIVVYDWEGNYITCLTLPMVGEAENLFIRGDKFILGVHHLLEDRADIYELTLTVSSDP